MGIGSKKQLQYKIRQGKVVSEEDAAVLREEFANLQKLMGMLQSEVDNVENGESADSNPQQQTQEDFEQQQQLPFPI